MFGIISSSLTNLFHFIQYSLSGGSNKFEIEKNDNWDHSFMIKTTKCIIKENTGAIQVASISKESV